MVVVGEDFYCSYLFFLLLHVGCVWRGMLETCMALLSVTQTVGLPTGSHRKDRASPRDTALSRMQ